ncbi:MAG: DUF4339 domain-containing protein [Candidatus Omnitrophica bacterium]|nr:DUF4339 domain-containing protein [Candidatus Omnitrophota bacterium]
MGKTYFVVVNDQQTGPLNEEPLKEKISRGEITAHTLAWCEGMEQWHAAGQIPGLSELFAGATQPPPLPGRSATPPPLPRNDIPVGLSPLEEKAYRFAAGMYRPWKGKDSFLSAYVRKNPKNAVYVSLGTIAVMIAIVGMIVAAFIPAEQQDQQDYQGQMMPTGQMPPANWQAGHQAMMDAQRSISDMSHDAYTYRRDRQDKSDDLYRKATYGADD